MSFWRRYNVILLLLSLVGASHVARADDYPVHPVKLIVPFAAGGATDIVARLITAKMREAGFGQPIVIENRGGGGGSIGSEAAARAEPDGYTLLLGTNSTHGTTRISTRSSTIIPSTVLSRSPRSG